MICFAPLSKAIKESIYIEAIEELERRSLVLEDSHYLYLEELEAGNEITVYDGDPDDGGIVLVGPFVVGTATGKLKVEEGAAICGFVVENRSLSDQVEDWEFQQHDGWWYVGLGPDLGVYKTTGMGESVQSVSSVTLLALGLSFSVGI